MSVRVRVAIAVLCSVAASACLDDVSGTRPLTLEVDPDVSTTTVGHQVTFTYDATGTGLTSVSVQFGDGEHEVKAYPGPVEVSDFVVHAYASAGTYTVVGRAIDTRGSVEDTVEITVN